MSTTALLPGMKPIFALLCLSAFVNLTLGLLSLYRHSHSKPNRTFFFLCLSIVAWTLLHALSLVQSTDQAALFYERMIMVPSSFIPGLALLFCYQIAQPDFNVRWSMLISHTVTTMFFLIFSFSPHMVKSASIRTDYVYWEPGWIYYLYSLYLLYCACAGILALITSYRKNSGKRRAQLGYVLLGTSLSLIIGLVLNVLLPILGWMRGNCFGPFGTLFLVAFISYAIVRHQLMDVTIFIRRAVLLGIIYAALLVLCLPLFFYLHREISTYMPFNYAPVLLVILGLIVALSVGPVLYAFFVRRNVFFHENTMASLTHELKSPLSLIESALDVLASEARHDADNPKQKEYLDMIDRNSARLRKFVDDLLLVMKTGAGKTQLTMTEVDMLDLCDAVVANFQEAAQAKGNTLVLEQSLAGKKPAALWTIQCDRIKIEQVLSNLISNANKFTRDGAITISLKKDDKALIIEVRDTGSGIATQDLPYIFDRFYQGEAGKNAKGTGIGLSIAKLWVEAHGGEIHAESEGVGKGSKIWFSIPI